MERRKEAIALFAGVVVAATLGMAAGGAMQPVLAIRDTHGPQQVGPTSGLRIPPSTDGSMTTWNGPVPDYVYGTDWMRQEDLPEVYTDESWREVPMEPPGDAPVEFTVAAYAEPQAPHVTIPSLDGDVAAVLGPAPPPATPENLDGSEAPPSA